jgi:hypothetical protein
MCNGKAFAVCFARARAIVSTVRTLTQIVSAVRTLTQIVSAVRTLTQIVSAVRTLTQIVSAVHTLTQIVSAVRTLTQILVSCLEIKLKWDTRMFNFIFKQTQMEFGTVERFSVPLA